MLNFLKEVYYVSWADLRFLKHNFPNILITSLVSPILYLITFGYGLGRGMSSGDISYVAFIIPGIVALSSLSSSFSSTSTRINVQRLYYNSLDEMMMCPLRPAAIILGKSMMGVLRGLLSCSIIFVMGLILSPEIMLTPLFICCLLISCFSFSFLGVMAALLAKSHQTLATFNSLVILPMTFLCGTFFSVSSVPALFQYILYLFPLTHASTCVRASALGWTFPWGSLAVLVAFGIAFYIIDVYLVKTRKV